MNGWLAIIVGSVAGGVSRYAMAGAVQRLHPTPFPIGTLAVNALGCAVIGFLSAAGGARFTLNFEARLLLITGFCGGFTTFSSLILETVALARSGATTMAAGYLASSLALGFLSFSLGAAAGRLL